MKNLIAFLLISWLLCCCTSTKKNKSSHQVKTDSTAEHSVVKKGISISKSTEVKEHDSSYQNEFSIEFGEEDATATANDYDGSDTLPRVFLRSDINENRIHHDIIFNGKKISSSRPIKSATFKEAGQVKKIDLQQLQKKDSGQSSQQNKVFVYKEDKTKEKTVHRAGANYLITISLVIILIAATGIGWKFGWFKRKNGRKNLFNKINS